MDAVEFIRERKRMCDTKEHCVECPIYEEMRNDIKPCITWDEEEPEKAVAIVEKWAREHPRKTRQNALLKAFPDASLDENGIVRVCPASVSNERRDEKSGGCGNANLDCYKCRYDFWMQEVD